MTYKIQFPTKAIIAGRSANAASGKTFETLNPANGKVLAKIVRCEKADVDIAVNAARNAFDVGPWPKMSPAERKVIMQRFASLKHTVTNWLN